MLPLIILASIGAIFIIFGNELMALVKKLFAKRLVALFFPLIVASICVKVYESWILFGLLSLKFLLYHSTLLLCSILPFATASWSIAAITIIALVTLLPVYVVSLLKKRKSRLPFQHRGLLSTIIWLLVVILFSVSLH